LTEVNNLTKVMLEDKKSGTTANLMNGAYTFQFDPTDGDTRFVLHFGPLSIDEGSASDASIYSFNNIITINYQNQKKGDAFIYTINGQLVKSVVVNQGMNRIAIHIPGTYIVKVVSNESTSIKKVLIE
jgi:hypothetical protein